MRDQYTALKSYVGQVVKNVTRKTGHTTQRELKFQAVDSVEAQKAG